MLALYACRDQLMRTAGSSSFLEIGYSGSDGTNRMRH